MTGTRIGSRALVRGLIALALPLLLLAAEAAALPIRVKARGPRIRTGRTGGGANVRTNVRPGTGNVTTRTDATRTTSRPDATRTDATRTQNNGGSSDGTTSGTTNGTTNGTNGTTNGTTSGTNNGTTSGTTTGGGLYGITVGPSKRSRLRDAGIHGLPGGRGATGRYRFRTPDGYNPGKPLKKGPNGGYLDRHGNEWVQGPYHGDPSLPFQKEWDVVLSKQGYNHWGRHAHRTADGKGWYVNVRPDGFLSH